ncbi:glycosyltransferase [Larkinella punicea]|uniref:Glycosyltransferase n=2 Tax=Larkinella punicea TaxID=2315727 RepID=A0A368JHJ2_9BACT|nr:glycosyltransferase [Larkinella punicea]
MGENRRSNAALWRFLWGIRRVRVCHHALFDGLLAPLRRQSKPGFHPPRLSKTGGFFTSYIPVCNPGVFPAVCGSFCLHLSSGLAAKRVAQTVDGSQHTMKLLINAFNLASAGGLNVALNFLKNIPYLKSDADHIHVIVPQACGYEALESDSFKIHYLPKALNHWMTRPLMDHVWYPKVLNEIKPEIIFTMGNFPSPVPYKQVVLLHLPHLAYPEDKALWKQVGPEIIFKIKLRDWVFRRRLTHVDILLVQTHTMLKRLLQVYPQLPSIQLFPNAYTLLNSQSTYELPVKKQPNLTYLMCLSRYYPHKNLEILVEVARLMKARQMPYRIFITIEAWQHPKAKRLLETIAQASLADFLIPIGNVPADCVASLYHQVDGLILPTLLESFTATYVDAMHFGVSIFTSQRDFAEEICGESAHYFDPLSAQSIVDTIHAGYSNETNRQHKISAGRLRSTTLPDWPEVSRTCWELLVSLAENKEINVKQ